MYNVTEDYKTGIYGMSQKTQGRVTFDISPVSIESDTPTITASNEFYVSRAQAQLTDNIRQPTLYLSTWEQDRTKLNGSFTFPSDTASDWAQVGWVSNTIGDSSGNLSSTSVTMAYASTYTLAGFTVTFDTLFGEYATDFTLQAYDTLNNVIHTSTITGNTLTQWKVVTPIANFKKVTLTITKWSVGNRRARVTEIDAGVILVYEDSSLVSMETTEELDPLSSTLVIPEFKFVVDNSNDEFDILNPSGIYSSLQQRQRIQAEIGLVLDTRIEWVPLGIYYLSEWRSDRGSMTATFTGRSKLDLLDTANYEQLTAKSSYSVYNLIVDILTAAGITNYSVDTALQSISTNGLMENRSCREALQLAAMAGQSIVYITRNDVLTVKKYAGVENAVDSITFGSMYNEPQIETGKPVKSITVEYFTSIGSAAGTYTYTDPTVSVGEVISLEGNTAINTNAQAQAVAIWILGRRNESKAFTIDYVGNMALELNDYIMIENRYVTNQKMYLTKIDINYEGYVYGQIKGKAV